eukprot:1152584-Pelagomonas_calceolata.AAC.1
MPSSFLLGTTKVYTLDAAADHQQKPAEPPLEHWCRHIKCTPCPAPRPLPCTSIQMECTIFQCRKGTFCNQKHAVRFQKSTSLACSLPGCRHMDCALYVLSGCQCLVIRNMVTKRRNIAHRMILKVASKGSYVSNLLRMDVGSAAWM